MIGRNLRYLVALVVCVLLPLAGCSGGGSTTKITSKGTEVTVGGKVDVAKAAKTAFLSSTSATAVNHVFVYNAQDGAQLGTATIGSDGSFSGLTFTLPAAKTVLVFKAVVAQGTFRSLVPVDLSNPPTAGGISASNPISIVISQQSTDIATAVSAMLGLSGVLGDANQTLASVSKTYTQCATEVVNAGGQTLAYTSAGLALAGTVSNANMLPAADASTLTVDDLNNIKLSGAVTSAFIPGKRPIVNFTVTNKATGKGIKGLRTFALHVAKLVPENNGSNSYWQNYISSGLPLAAIPANVTRTAPTVPVAPAVPGTDAADLYVNGQKIASGYTVIDHGDGSYTVTFGADITANTNVAYAATATHRIGISVRSVAVPGGYTGPINPATNAAQAVFTTPNTTNMFYDFTPADGAALTDTDGNRTYARDIVTAGVCDSCHYKLGLAAGNMLSGHTGSRVDTKLCVMCHTNQFDGGEGEFVTFIHRIHMGETFNDANDSWTVPTGDLVSYGEQTYPQDIRNCKFCHQGAIVNAWMANPSRKACGSCHNAITWTSHQGGQTNDSSCKGCHASGNTYVEVSNAHLPVQAPDQDAPEFGGTNTHTYAGYLPAAGVAVPGAAVITWDVKSVAVVATRPTITFRFKKNGNPVVFNTYQAGVVTELMTGFTGSPSVYFAFSVPQDGITAPADYNATASANIKKVWNGATATSTMTGPDSNGYYTITINNVIVPGNAKMFTGGIGYTYGSTATPLTQTDLSALTVPATFKTKWAYTSSNNRGGLIVVTPNVWKVGTDFTGRRTIVSNAKCNACHAALGIAPTFHSGQRNDAPTCSFCHTVNKTNSGWSVNAKDAIHSIHAAAKRSSKFSWEVSAGDTYWKTTYPGYLQDCEQCHITGSYDFSATASASAVNNLLPSTVATGNVAASVPAIVTGDETVPGTYYAPLLASHASEALGSGFSFDGATGTATQAAATTLVISPITSACFSCHDGSQARAHMKQFGGLIYQARSNLATTSETCLVCHGTASNVLNDRVPTIKAVHRWW